MPESKGVDLGLNRDRKVSVRKTFVRYFSIVSGGESGSDAGWTCSSVRRMHGDGPPCTRSVERVYAAIVSSFRRRRYAATRPEPTSSSDAGSGTADCVTFGRSVDIELNLRIAEVTVRIEPDGDVAAVRDVVGERRQHRRVGDGQRPRRRRRAERACVASQCSAGGIVAGHSCVGRVVAASEVGLIADAPARLPTTDWLVPPEYRKPSRTSLTPSVPPFVSSVAEAMPACVDVSSRSTQRMLYGSAARSRPIGEVVEREHGTRDRVGADVDAVQLPGVGVLVRHIR